MGEFVEGTKDDTIYASIHPLNSQQDIHTCIYIDVNLSPPSHVMC